MAWNRGLCLVWRSCMWLHFSLGLSLWWHQWTQVTLSTYYAGCLQCYVNLVSKRLLVWFLLDLGSFSFIKRHFEPRVQGWRRGRVLLAMAICTPVPQWLSAQQSPESFWLQLMKVQSMVQSDLGHDDGWKQTSRTNTGTSGKCKQKIQHQWCCEHHVVYAAPLQQ